MKYIVILSIIVTTLLSTSVRAADSVVVVDVKMIINESLAGKDITKQIEAKREEFQKEVTKEEDSLRKEEKTLAEQRSILSKEVFEKQAKDFQGKVVEAQRMVQSRRTQLENAYVEALKVVREKTLEIITELAAEKNFSVALPESSVLYASASQNISADVLKKIDKALPKVKVVIKEVKEEKEEKNDKKEKKDKK